MPDPEVPETEEGGSEVGTFRELTGARISRLQLTLDPQGVKLDEAGRISFVEPQILSVLAAARPENVAPGMEGENASQCGCNLSQCG